LRADDGNDNAERDVWQSDRWEQSSHPRHSAEFELSVRLNSGNRRSRKPTTGKYAAGKYADAK
jgi:hypothetical protein